MTRPQHHNFGFANTVCSTFNLFTFEQLPAPAAFFHLTMAPARVPQKRILGESTNTRRNIPSSPSSAKKRKLEPFSSPAARFKSSQNGPKGKVGSSQPSHFESEVLEKMTQDMAGLRKNNSEKDQEWARPGLGNFNAQNDNLSFQQIECEEGTVHGGKATVKLFGVTEASLRENPKGKLLTQLCRPATLSCSTSPISSTTYTLLLQSPSLSTTAMGSKHIWRHRLRSISLPYIPFRWSFARIYTASKETNKILTSKLPLQIRSS